MRIGIGKKIGGVYIGASTSTKRKKKSSFSLGLFAPKITKAQQSHISLSLKQLNDSASLVNTTVKPDVFFKRLHLTLDLFMDLMQYEKYKAFKKSSPTKNFNSVVGNMEATVNDFIDRAVEDNQKKIDGLKTDKAKVNRNEKFANSLMAAFDSADTFWSGNTLRPHYTGPLFTDNNYRRVQEIYENSL